MLQRLFDLVFGCSHQRTTFPMTRGRKPFSPLAITAAANHTYVVCLDCGKEFDYDWKSMRVSAEVNAAPPAAVEPVYR